MTFREFYKRYFTVHKCGGCRELLSYENIDDALCPNCIKKWNMAKTESCGVCFQSAIECSCMPSGLSKKGALCLRKLYFYDSKKRREPQNQLLYFIKQKKNRRAARFFAKELSKFALDELSVLGIDNIEKDALIVNVPRSKKAKLFHGFDQAELVSAELSKITNIPFLPLIKRQKGGKEQKQLDRTKRFRNVQSLFCIESGENIKGKYVILFDDIVTTGASMAACTSLLMKSGAKGVICISIAQVNVNKRK